MNMNYGQERDTQKADKKRLKQILDAGNVAEILDEDQLGRIGTQVVSMYEVDEGDGVRQSKMDKWREGQKIVQQIIEVKNTPFENASNVKYPMLTTACIQFNARSYPQIIKGNSVVRPQLVGVSKIPELPDLPADAPPEVQEQYKALQERVQKMKAKQAKADNACEYMNWQLFNELVEWEADTDRLLLMLPLYGDMFRKVWHSKSKGRLESRLISPEHLILPCNAPSLDESPRISECFYLYPNQIEERIRQGDYLAIPYHDDDDKPHELIEQHCWYDLDEDGYKEPYIVIVHRETGKVCQILANFTMESVQGNGKGEVSSITPIKHYQHYQFIPSSDGSIYGLGFFDILYPINETINTTINMLLDAGRLANSNSGFIAREARIKRGSIKMQVGEWTSVPVKGDDIRKGMVPLQFPGPSTALFQLLGFMVEVGKDVANIKDVLMGEQRPNQTATATLALIEQGTKVFSAIHKRIYRALKGEFDIIRRWNVLVLDQSQYEEVMDLPVKKEDFDDVGYDFVPVADPEVATDMQRMGRAEFLLSFRGDPYINQMEIRKRVLDAANIEDPDDLIQEPAQSVEVLQQQVQQLQQQLQKSGQMQIHYRAKELELKERELALKEAKNPADIAAQKAAALDRVASAESREAGNQLEKYKIQAGVEDGKRGRLLELEKLRRNQMGNGRAQ
jgi:chaperonin GroES